MPTPISYTPPDAATAQEGAHAAPPDAAVARRHVFYLPGYDPESRTRYRLLFVRELTLHAKRFGTGKPEIGRASLSADGLVQSWRVGADGVETAYDVLLWDDIVARDAARSKFVSAALLAAGTIQTIATGLMVAFYRLNWKYGNIILYPFVMLSLLGIAGAGIALAVSKWLNTWLAGLGVAAALPGWLALGLGIAAGLAFIRMVEALINRIYFWQLLNDWVFNWQHGRGWRGDYADRLDAFVARIRERLDADAARGEAPDEVLIVGHSPGALTAVEVTARLIASDPAIGTAPGPVLSLVTLGSGMPLVAMQAKAARVRADIASLVACPRLTWADYVAPQDWLNFPRFNPILGLDLGLPEGARLFNPTIRSARFRDIIDDETYLRVRFRPFRMHFQFLMANDRPGAYDYFAMTLGPRTLRERLRDTVAGPGTAPGGDGLAAGPARGVTFLAA